MGHEATNTAQLVLELYQRRWLKAGTALFRIMSAVNCTRKGVSAVLKIISILASNSQFTTLTRDSSPSTSVSRSILLNFFRLIPHNRHHGQGQGREEGPR